MVERHIYPRLEKIYHDKIMDELKDQFGYKNVMEIPTLKKIVVSMGIGDAARDSKIIQTAVADLALITAQHPRTNKAKKSIAQFKLRQGQIIGVSSTIRGARMWEFYDRVTALAIPKMRDFRGFSPKQFDGHGNYTFGMQEQLVFPEIDPDNIDQVRGMDITIVTSAKTDDEARELLKKLGFPFKEK
ncbi:MAG: 50S ribosomal protein L5 [Bifidobacteriaceae bacterium]|jgi:large subunit ribosomal protein L5|nr:50S ribosomal protein L5 [Bifidobacteriaceae bacterium]